MSVLVALALIIAGLTLLAVGGDVLVRGAVTLARVAGLTTAVIGLTVVAFGTSMPELVVSVIASLRHQPDITVGNVVGSNLFNTLAILGITAVVRPVPIHSAAVKVDWPVTVLVTAVWLVLSRDRLLDRLEGAVFLFGLTSFIALSVWLARREVSRAEAQAVVGRVEGPVVRDGAKAIALSAALVVTGLSALILGGRLLVDGSVQLARIAGISERVIGLTIVAAGTSAPELAASVAAARKGHSEIAVANLLGSNIFNLLGILGVTAVIRPVPVSAEILRGDAWWLLGSALVLFPLMRAGRSINRLEGGALVACYAAYLTLLMIRG